MNTNRKLPFFSLDLLVAKHRKRLILVHQKKSNNGMNQGEKTKLANEEGGSKQAKLQNILEELE